MRSASFLKAWSVAFTVLAFSLVDLGQVSSRLNAAESTSPAVVSPTPADEIKAWSAYKYGMFIHFGINTYVTGAENNPADFLLPPATYAPTALDVDQWVRVARDAGMKYAVLTAKHVSGFCLWDTKVQWHGKEYDYDVANSGNKTDVIAAFVEACKKYGIAPGLYWSPLDFRNSSTAQAKSKKYANNLPADFFQFSQDQLAELIAKYPDVGYYWLDIPRAASLEQRRILYEMIKQKRPGTLVLFNHGTSKWKGALTIDKCQSSWPTDFFNTERNPIKPGQYKAEQAWQGNTYYMGYEHCDCLGSYWFYRAGDHPRPLATLLGLYTNTIAAGGNLLLDVPPDPSGRISDEKVQALMELKKSIDQTK